MAEKLGMNLVTAALNGGEDYELLFTVPLHDHEKVSKLPGVKVIGHITKESLGCAMITRDNHRNRTESPGLESARSEMTVEKRYLT
ncbi:hypothetical protein [Muribaculum gordoncarteri]|uniref:hypothetical protein n=1 Tax=Muribaculum gordoncarteri TaxID=2530390 RepID=UPI003F66A532